MICPTTLLITQPHHYPPSFLHLTRNRRKNWNPVRHACRACYACTNPGGKHNNEPNMQVEACKVLQRQHPVNLQESIENTRCTIREASTPDRRSSDLVGAPDTTASTPGTHARARVGLFLVIGVRIRRGRALVVLFIAAKTVVQ